MAILNWEQMKAGYDDDLPESEVLVIDRNTSPFSPELRSRSEWNIKTILEHFGQGDQGVADVVVELAKSGNLKLTGRMVGNLLGDAIPRVRGFYQMAEHLSRELSFPFPYLTEDTRQACLIRESQRNVIVDLDFVVDGKIDLEWVKKFREENTIYGEVKHNPTRVIMAPMKRADGDYSGYDDWSIGIDCIVSVVEASSLSKHCAPGTSLDLQSLDVTPTGGIIIKLEDLAPQQLSIVGLDELAESPTTSKSQIVALDFMLGSLMVRDGVRIATNFGENIESQEKLFKFLEESVTSIIQNRESYSKSWFETNPYYQLLSIVQPYWPLLDSRIQKVVVKCF